MTSSLDERKAAMRVTQANASAITSMRARQAPEAKAQPEGIKEWSLDSSNEGSKFRSVLAFDKFVSSTDPPHSTSDEVAERLARPDRVHATLLFTNVQGAPQATISFSTSFDGVRYSVYSSIGPVPVSSGFLLNLYTTAVALPNALIRGAISFTGGSADVKGWVTSLMRGRRRFGIVAMDRVMNGTNTYYSEADFNDMLGKVDQLSILVTTDQVQGSGVVTLTLDIEESPDGVEWAKKVTLVNAISIVSDTTFNVEDNGAMPSSQFVRIAAKLGGSSAAANVRICVVGRGR